MEKTPIQRALERAYSNPASDLLNPDNHDKVHIALGLFAEESAQKVREAMDNLGGQVAILSRAVRETAETQISKLIGSNEKLAASNEKHTRAMLSLTRGLVFVGVLQAIITAVQVYMVYVKQNM